MKGTLWCLHGAVGMADDWRGLAVPGWAVKRVDLWRFLACAPMSLEEFGAALNAEASRLPGPHALLGYSMGGRLGLHALLAGGPWRAAVIASAHPGLTDEAERRARRERDAEWAAKALRGRWAEFLDEWEAQGVLAPGDPGPPDQAAMRMADRATLEIRRQEIARSFIDWSLGTQEALGSRLPEIRVPTLWIAGERDGKFAALVRDAGAGRSGDGLERDAPAPVWIAPGCGHRVPWESAAFPGRVGEFLERVIS